MCLAVRGAVNDRAAFVDRIDSIHGHVSCTTRRAFKAPPLGNPLDRFCDDIVRFHVHFAGNLRIQVPVLLDERNEARFLGVLRAILDIMDDFLPYSID